MNSEEIIVVYQKRRAEFAHLLAQLISACTNHEVAEWEEKHWESNKATITTSQKIIFLGGAGDSYSMGMKWFYQEFSMKYGWLGNRCVIDVDMVEFGKIYAFKKHYEKRAEHFKYIAEKAKGVGLAWFALIGGWVTAPIILVSALWVDMVNLKKYQYQVLICEFVLEGGFEQFMEA